MAPHELPAMTMPCGSMAACPRTHLRALNASGGVLREPPILMPGTALSCLRPAEPAVDPRQPSLPRVVAKPFAAPTKPV